MLRSTFMTTIGVLVLCQTVLRADDVKQPKSADKPDVKQVDKKKQPVLLQKADKTKQPQKEQPSVAILASDAEYYTTSPAQGQPADGQVKAGTKVRVLEKAGSYTRVAIQIEAYVPADSLVAPEKLTPGTEKPAIDKGVLKKKEAAGKDAVPDKFNATDKKQVIDKVALLKKKEAAGKDAVPDKQKAAEKKQISDKQQAAEDNAALKKKAAIEKQAAAAKQNADIDKAALKKKAIAEKAAAAEKKAAASKETEKKVDK